MTSCPCCAYPIECAVPSSLSRLRSVPADDEWCSDRCAPALCFPNERMLARLARCWMGASCDRRGRAGTGTSPMPPAGSGLADAACTRRPLRWCSSAVVRDAFDMALIRGGCCPGACGSLAVFPSFSRSHPLTRWPQLSVLRSSFGGSYGPL